jgi:hypothetical protein
MGIDVVALDRFAVLFGDELLPVVAKARSQAIDGLAFVAEAVDMGAAVVDALFIFFGKRDFAPKRATLTRSLMVAVPPSVTVFISDRTS